MEYKLIIWKKDRINYIVGGVCAYYDISRNELMRRARKKSLTCRKGILIKLLRDVADCTYKDICDALDVGSIRALYGTYQGISMDLDPESYGNKELKATYLEILEYLGL